MKSAAGTQTFRFQAALKDAADPRRADSLNSLCRPQSESNLKGPRVTQGLPVRVCRRMAKSEATCVCEFSLCVSVRACVRACVRVFEFSTVFWYCLYYLCR